MKVDYKGFEINVEREKCLGGWGMLYYQVVEKDTGYFLIDSFEDSSEKVRDQVNFLKGVVDRYLNIPKTCGNCMHRLGEECGITGAEVFDDDIADCCDVNF